MVHSELCVAKSGHQEVDRTQQKHRLVSPFALLLSLTMSILAPTSMDSDETSSRTSRFPKVLTRASGFQFFGKPLVPKMSSMSLAFSFHLYWHGR